ncbi:MULTISPECIES: hypothetical protein [Rhizobium]|uniref:DUF805 domain-containing protein n=1 Tax=Rhizobium rhododendri TaxID=2506430 RepID=A0ABY8IMN6_9HYPH|nr:MULTISPECIES: hypothetical protein [Rhizobium]TQX86761.1 hypothetical protein EQW76_16485 [Rhizobium sp. rho-13.1]TQY11372.1 hypothetical protein EQW74_17800 [Rhizobium sp. rho-1.1]WFS24959.1 hypothetical protein PR018_21940 [Rhizobium rhododendri]
MHTAPIERQAASNRFHPSYFIGALLVVLYCYVVISLSRAIDDDVILIVLVVFPGLLAVVVWLACTCWILIKWDWRRALSLFAAPFLAWMPFIVLVHFGFDSDWFRFKVEKHNFLQDVEESAALAGHPVLIHWFWASEGGGFGNFGHEWLLIYDEMDQLSQPSKSWSDEFRRKMSKPNASGRLYGTYSEGTGLSVATDDYTELHITNMGGHFYLAQCLQ